MTPTQDALRAALDAIPERLALGARTAATAPPAGEWDRSDIVRHLIAVELEVWQPRLRQMVAGDSPHWAWVEPDRWLNNPAARLDALIATFAARRAETTALVDELDDAGWARTGTHATRGVLDVAALVAWAVEHDEEHFRSFAALGRSETGEHR